MKTRIITGVVAIALFVPICIFSGTVVFPIVMGLLCLIGVNEIAKCLKFDKNYIITIPMYIIALGLPILRYFTKNSTNFMAITMVLVFGMLIYTLAYIMLSKNIDALKDYLSLFALFFYIVGCFSTMVMVRLSVNGKFMYLLVFLGAWVCDTFAYFVGFFFGKHKLIPEISPKKTIEGSIGGIVFTVIGFAIYTLIVNSAFGAQLSYVKICIIGLVLSIVSQLGDLIASTIKRHYGIKDYGRLFPEHGGVLDRFDSVMLAAPTLYIMNVLLNLI